MMGNCWPLNSSEELKEPLIPTMDTTYSINHPPDDILYYSAKRQCNDDNLIVYGISPSNSSDNISTQPIKQNRVIMTKYDMIDLSEFPVYSEPENPIEEIILGDMHGNPMLLIYALIRFQVLDCTKDVYDKLYEYCGIEQLANPFNDKQLDIVFNLINELKLSKNNTVKNILFLGDLLADRGPNDLFMLFLLSRLTYLNISYEILLSNHDYEFIRQAEGNFQLEGIGHRTITSLLDDTHKIINGTDVASTAHSLEVFMKMVNGTEPWQGIMKMLALNIYERVYKPVLKIASWRIISDKLILFTHAPVGLTTIGQINNHLNSYTIICPTMTNNVFKCHTAEELCNNITIMNNNFKQFINIRGWFDILFSTQVSSDHSFICNPFIKIMWNRNSIDIDGIKQWKSDSEVYDGDFKDGMNPQKIHFVHGHDGVEIPPCAKDYVMSLDHVCGCGMRCYYSRADINKFPIMLLI